MLRIHMKQTITINKHENEGWKHCDDPKTFNRYSSNMDDIYRNIDE